MLLSKLFERISHIFVQLSSLYPFKRSTMNWLLLNYIFTVENTKNTVVDGERWYMVAVLVDFTLELG